MAIFSRSFPRVEMRKAFSYSKHKMDRANEAFFAPLALRGISSLRVRRVESIRADLCFLEMCSLRPEVGITVGNQEEANGKQAMIRASTERIGLISLGKMGTSLPYPVHPVSRLTCFLSDASDADVLNPYRAEGIEVTSTQPKRLGARSFRCSWHLRTIRALAGSFLFR